LVDDVVLKKDVFDKAGVVDITEVIDCLVN